MPARILLAFVALALTLPAGPIRAQGAAPTASPEALTAAWVAMWNSYDLDEVDRLFVLDAGVTYFSSEKPGVIKGVAALRDHHAGFGFVKGGRKPPNTLWLEDSAVTRRGDAAIVTAIWFFKRADGTVQKGPVTLVLARAGGEYRIAHAHFANY